MTNVIDAEIQGNDCRLPWGVACKVENPTAQDTEGVAIRPEDLAIELAETDHHSVIEQAMLMGASTHYWIDVNGQTLRAITSGGGNAILPIGQKVRLVPPTSLHLLRRYPGEQS